MQGSGFCGQCTKLQTPFLLVECRFETRDYGHDDSDKREYNEIRDAICTEKLVSNAFSRSNRPECNRDHLHARRQSGKEAAFTSHEICYVSAPYTIEDGVRCCV
jgi:hypothetical protein